MDILNHKPIAEPGNTQEWTEGQLVTLYGNKSYDPDGTIDHFSWTQIEPDDIRVTLDDESAANPTFRTPTVSSVKTLVFDLRVTDNKGEMDNRTLVIKIKPSHPPVSSWGLNGTGEAQFQSPQGIAIDPLFNNVYVVDKGNSRIQAFDMDGHPLTPSEWGSEGKGPGQFFLPENIAFDSKDEFIYVADSGNNRIQKFTTWGRNITSWGSLCDLHNPVSCRSSDNSSELGAGQFRYPQGLAVDFKGNVYVADFSNDRIQKFDSNGTFLKMWGTSCNLRNDRDSHCKDPDGKGSNQIGDGQFYRPKGITINPKSDEVYVVDKVNDRIQKFDSNGTFLSKWGSSGTGDGEFYAPEYITIDPRDGTVYVGDENNDRIQKFDSNGTFLSKWGSSGSGLGQFQNPEGIGIDSRTGEIYVADENNNRIQKFAPKAD
jgi:DNA-binding beta-propeller fold protein YncE